MSKTTIFAGLAVASLVAASVVATPVLAWHPKGVIVKYVQNQTTGSAMSDANDAAHAVTAKPGDVLKYTIVVRNDGAADDHGYNDMAKTTLTDTLPTGVELVSNASQRTITADLGTVKPGNKVTKEYVVKVTAGKAGLIENKACFTGNSTANDNPQKGCDVADITVTIPTPPTQPPQTPPQQPQPPVSTPAPEAPVAIAATGPVEIIGGLVGISALSYAGLGYLRSKRALNASHTR